MFYLIYLAGLLILLLAAITVKIAPTLSISVENIANFLDIWSVLPVLSFSVLALACTKTLKPMGSAFSLMFSKAERTVGQLKESLLAVRTAFWAAMAGGGICGVIRAANLIRDMELAGSPDSALGYPSVAVLLPLYYGLIIGLILLPVSVSLRQEIIRRDSGRQENPAGANNPVKRKAQGKARRSR